MAMAGRVRGEGKLRGGVRMHQESVFRQLELGSPERLHLGVRPREHCGLGGGSEHESVKWRQNCSEMWPESVEEVYATQKTLQIHLGDGLGNGANRGHFGGQWSDAIRRIVGTLADGLAQPLHLQYELSSTVAFHNCVDCIRTSRLFLKYATWHCYIFQRVRDDNLFKL